MSTDRRHDGQRTIAAGNHGIAGSCYRCGVDVDDGNTKPESLSSTLPVALTTHLPSWN